MPCERKLGQGTYGCVYSPPQNCVKGSRKRYTKNRTKTQVGKVFGNKELAEDERIIMEIVRSLDPVGRYTTTLEETCEVAVTSDLRTTCGLVETGTNSVPQLIYPYRGTDLCAWSEAVTFDIMDHLEGLLNIARGLFMLSKAGYCHRDLKPSNVMVHNNTMYLTDFGLMIPFTRMYDIDQDYVLNFDYEFYPPEFKIYYDSTHLSDWSKGVEDLPAFVTSDVKTNYVGSINRTAFEDVDKVVQLLLNKYTTSEVFRESLEVLASKVDVFSFGMTFMGMFSKSAIRTSEGDLGRRKRLYELLLSCVDPNPLTRIDIEELVDALADLLQFVE
jgi:serine/threonine protein kinase